MERVAVVSAGDTGLGLTVTTKLARSGSHVYIATRHKDRADGIARRLHDEGFLASVLEVDVCVPSSVEAAFVGLDQVDVLVNAAGAHTYRPLEAMSVGDVHHVLDPALIGTFLMCQQAVARMRPGGRIVNVASLSMYGGRRVAHYAAAKAAVVGFSRALATELAEQEIGVNVVVPSLLDTPMTRRSLREDEIQNAAQRGPRGRLVTPEEVADVIAFLASANASAITGQSLIVDGGASLPR